MTGIWNHQIPYCLRPTHPLTGLPSLLRCSCVMVARTPAACSPPITEIRAFGHMYRNLNKVHFRVYQTVLRIGVILIRIRIRSSVWVNNGSGCWSGSGSDLKSRKYQFLILFFLQKNIFLQKTISIVCSFMSQLFRWFKLNKRSLHIYIFFLIWLILVWIFHDFGRFFAEADIRYNIALIDV